MTTQHNTDDFVSLIINDDLLNIPLLESSIEFAMGKPVLAYIANYLLQCLAKNPEIRFDSHLSNVAAIKIFFYWLVQYRSEQEMSTFLILFLLNFINY